MSRLIGNVDGRPRVYVWEPIVPGVIGVRWCHGPAGKVRTPDSIGEAFAMAIEELGGKPAVFIWLGTSSGPGTTEDLN